MFRRCPYGSMQWSCQTLPSLNQLRNEAVRRIGPSDAHGRTAATSISKSHPGFARPATCTTNMEHGQLEHVAQRQSQSLGRAGDAGQRAGCLRPGVAVGRQATDGGGGIADRGPAPLRTTRGLPGWISTADRIEKPEGSGWRTTLSACAPAAAADAADSRSAATGRRGTRTCVQWACRVRSATDAAAPARATATRLAGTGSAWLPQAPRT